MTTSHFAVLVTTHVHPVPEGLEEPHGIFDSLDDARSYVTETCNEWMAELGGWPFRDNIRINEYATRQQAENADTADGTETGGAKPLKIWAR